MNSPSNNVDENFSDMNDDDFINYLKKQEQIKEFRSEKDYEEQRKRRKTMYQTILVTYTAAAVLGMIFYILYSTIGTEQMEGIFSLNKDVLFALNMAVNVFIYSLPAFIIACLGSFTKILLSESKLEIVAYLKLVLGSGLIGVLTFLGLKSGIVLDLIVDTVHTESITISDDKKSFYKMITLCFITGMFSTTIFLTVEERVQNLANRIKHS